MSKDDLQFETDEDGNKFVVLSEQDAIAQRDRLRKAEADAEAAARATTLERENAFLKAGVPAGVIGDMFMETYKGDLTKEAILEAAAKVPGLISEGSATTETTKTELTPEQQAAADAEAKQTQERSDLARNAADAAVVPDKHPHDAMREAIETARKAGASEPVAQSAGLSQLVQAAAAGDKRVLAPGSATVS